MSIDRWSRNEIALGMCPDGPFVQLSEYESLARQHREEVEAAEAATLRSQGQADAFDAGWRMAAAWAYRDDLLADMDSIAYKTERGAALAAHGKGG